MSFLLQDNLNFVNKDIVHNDIDKRSISQESANLPGLSMNNETYLAFPQVLVILSAALLQESDEVANVLRDLEIRLQRLSFRGSVVLIDAGGENERQHDFARLLNSYDDHVLQVPVQSIQEERWTDLDAALRLWPATNGPRLAMDSAEFQRVFLEGGIAIHSGPQNLSELDGGRPRWELANDEEGADKEDKIALVAQA